MKTVYIIKNLHFNTSFIDANREKTQTILEYVHRSSKKSLWNCDEKRRLKMRFVEYDIMIVT